MEFSNSTLAFEGKLKEHFIHNPKEETEYWLYHLEDVEKEPKDYKFRIKIRKL